MQIFWIIVPSVFFWSSLFSLVAKNINLRMPETELWDFRNRLVSFIHGIYCVWFSVNELWREGSFGCENTFSQEIVLSISIGYFIYDTICMAKYQIGNFYFYTHHLLVIYVVTSALRSNTGAYEIIWGYFVTEMTNPLLHLKDGLKMLGQKDSALYIFIEVLYISGYCFSRYAVGLFIVYEIISADGILIETKLGTIVIELLFASWGKIMLGILKKRFEEYKERRKSGISLPWLILDKKSE